MANPLQHGIVTEKLEVIPDMGDWSHSIALPSTRSGKAGYIIKFINGFDTFNCWCMKEVFEKTHLAIAGLKWKVTERRKDVA